MAQAKPLSVGAKRAYTRRNGTRVAGTVTAIENNGKTGSWVTLSWKVGTGKAAKTLSTRCRESQLERV